MLAGTQLQYIRTRLFANFDYGRGRAGSKAQRLFRCDYLHLRWKWQVTWVPIP